MYSTLNETAHRTTDMQAPPERGTYHAWSAWLLAPHQHPKPVLGSSWPPSSAAAPPRGRPARRARLSASAHDQAAAGGEIRQRAWLHHRRPPQEEQRPSWALRQRADRHRERTDCSPDKVRRPRTSKPQMSPPPPI